MIIGVTGSMGSGKGEVSKFLASKEFNLISFGDIARQEAKKRGIEPTRENLQKLGIELDKEEGADFVIRRVLVNIQENKNYVIEGIRYLEDLEILRTRKDFVLIGIIDSLESRWQRILTRNREGDPKDFDEFKKLDSIDNGETKNKSGPATLKCIESADFILINNSTLENLQENISKILSKFKVC